MKICVANTHLTMIGGSELWTYTMADTLLKLGHEVVVYTRNQGAFSRDMFRKYIPVSSTPVAADLYLINQVTCWEDLKAMPGKKIYTTHSSIVDLMLDRIPTSVTPDVTLVAISQEVAAIEAARGFTCQVIGNPIDMGKFYPLPIRAQAKVVLSMSMGGKANAIIQEACERSGLEFRHIAEATYDLEPYLYDADIVIGIGRCLLNAMAMNKNAISGDYRDWMPSFQGAGMITEENYAQLQPYFFSGRDHPIQLHVEQLCQEFQQYDANRRLRERMNQDYNAITVAQQYLRFA